MGDFNRMTVVAAVQIISDFRSHGEMSMLEAEWGIAGKSNPTNKSFRIASWVQIAIDDSPTVMTEFGPVSLDRAIVETALSIGKNAKPDIWRKFVAGLRFDGFEINEVIIQDNELNDFGTEKPKLKLVRMLPDDVPGLDFREAESEVVALLDSSGFAVAKGHLRQALSAFERGEWSSANGELRNFFESYLNEIAVALGCDSGIDSKAKRDFLGADRQPPFLLAGYNEWHSNSQKPQYVQGLMSRMHPHGGHPGLSEEEDATFRLQITLITARLFLRRFNQRKTA